MRVKREKLIIHKFTYYAPKAAGIGCRETMVRHITHSALDRINFVSYRHAGSCDVHNPRFHRESKIHLWYDLRFPCSGTIPYLCSSMILWLRRITLSLWHYRHHHLLHMTGWLLTPPRRSDYHLFLKRKNGKEG